MSRWSVWQMSGSAPERVGAFASRGDALRVWRTAAKRRSAVYDGAVGVEESDDLSLRDAEAIARAVTVWLSRAPTEPAPALHHVEPDEGEPDALGLGAATEVPQAVDEAPLPVAFEPPVVAVETAAGEIERLRVLLAEETALRVRVEAERAALSRELGEALSARGIAQNAAGVAEHDRADALRDRDVARRHLALVEAERDALAASLRERSEQLDEARSAVVARVLRLPAPVPSSPTTTPRRVRKAPAEASPVAQLAAYLRERATR